MALKFHKRPYVFTEFLTTFYTICFYTGWAFKWNIITSTIREIKMSQSTYGLHVRNETSIHFYVN